MPAKPDQVNHDQVELVALPLRVVNRHSSARSERALRAVWWDMGGTFWVCKNDDESCEKIPKSSFFSSLFHVLYYMFSTPVFLEICDDLAVRAVLWASCSLSGMEMGTGPDSKYGFLKKGNPNHSVLT